MSLRSFPVLDLTAEAVETYLIIYQAPDRNVTDDLLRSVALELRASRYLKHAFRNELARILHDRFADPYDVRPS